MKTHSCYAGCSTCCHWPVPATLAEANTIVMSMTPERRLEVAQLVREWLAKAGPLVESGRSLPLAEWNRRKIACPLLLGNLCSVYENRPAVCRTRLTSGPTFRCYNNPDTQVFEDSSVEIQAFLERSMEEGDVTFDHLSILLAACLGMEASPSGLAGKIAEIED